MTRLTEEGRAALSDLARRHNVSDEAVEHLLMALVAGQGTQAQFNHPELGGMGQWSQGGMTMVGDMFNNALKARVDTLCSDIAHLMRHSMPLLENPQTSSQSQSQDNTVSLFVGGGSGGNWWPSGLGHAASTGAQNQMRYAWFPDTARLAIDAGDGKVRVYDTADHRIGGFSQQQSGDQSLSFTSQYGLVKLADLREVDLEQPGDSGTKSVNEKSAPALSDALIKAATGSRAEEASPAEVDAAFSGSEQVQPEPNRVETPPVSASAEESDIFAKIERLAALHAKRILSDQEYQSKKAELLARI